MARKKYTDEDRAAGLAALEANGGESAMWKTSKQLGVPYNTMKHWVETADDATANLRSEKRANLAERLQDIAHSLVDAIPGKVNEATLQQVATSLGITIDKYRLLRGEATDISEVRNSDAKQQLADRLARLADRPTETPKQIN